MECNAMRPSQSWNAFSGDRVALTLAVVVCLFLQTSAAAALAAAPSQERFTLVLFGDLPHSDGFDANRDGALTVADIVGLLFAGTVAELVPHALGDQLVYRITDPLGVMTTETTTVISSGTGGAFVIEDREVDAHQKILTDQMQSYTDTGSQLFFNNFTDLSTNVRTACNPPLLRLTTPLVVGQTFSTTIQCDVSFADTGVVFGTVDRTDTFTPKEILDSYTVQAGTYSSVVHISGTTNQSGQLEADEIYIAQGVGPILQLATFSGKTYRHELISGTIGRQPVGR
jgi:hypothetical protein